MKKLYLIPKPAKKRRLVRGKDFDAWAYKYVEDGSFDLCTISLTRPGPDWVRVRFVEVKP